MVHFLLSFQSRTPAFGTDSPAFREVFPSQSNLENSLIGISRGLSPKPNSRSYRVDHHREEGFIVQPSQWTVGLQEILHEQDRVARGAFVLASLIVSDEEKKAGLQQTGHLPKFRQLTDAAAPKPGLPIFLTSYLAACDC